MITIEGYHGTDLECANNIIKTGFTYTPSDKHWLGNGVYFYLDFSLAEWWTTNPSNSFGTRVQYPAIVKTTIDFSEDDQYLDLRKLSDYKIFSELYFDEYIPLVESGVYDIKMTDTKRLRCSFCDYLKYQYDLKGIIGNFSSQNQRYFSDEYKQLQKSLKLYYIETQLCIFYTRCITSKELYMLK